MSIMVGTGRGAGAGVLIRNAEALELLAKVDTLVVDKTGTLTEGKPRLVTVDGPEDVLALAASLERVSEHPLAAAVVRGASERGVRLLPVDDFRSLTGKGVRGRVAGKTVALGNRALLGELGIEPGALAERAETLRREGQTVMFVAVDGRASGLLGVADPIKASTPEALDLLRQAGIRIMMVTGDSRTTADAVARKLGIVDVKAEVLPEAKSEVVKSLVADVYNALGVPVAAGVLYPFAGLLLNPMIAAAAMSLSSVSVIGNALRLRRLEL
jgi:Cu+-exporting ATPase